MVDHYFQSYREHGELPVERKETNDLLWSEQKRRTTTRVVVGIIEQRRCLDEASSANFQKDLRDS